MVRFEKITVEACVQPFLTHEIVRIENRPVYSTLKTMLKALRKCTEVVRSTQKKGHMYLALVNAEFLPLTTETKDIPTHPKLIPDVDLKDT